MRTNFFLLAPLLAASACLADTNSPQPAARLQQIVEETVAAALKQFESKKLASNQLAEAWPHSRRRAHLPRQRRKIVLSRRSPPMAG
jgi:hypothetical protein